MANRVPGRKRGNSSSAIETSPNHFLFEQNPVPTFVYDTNDLQILAVNDAFAAKYGYSREEATNLRLPDIYPEEERGLVAGAVKTLEETVETRELRHRAKGGSQIVALKHSRGIDFEGHSARIVVVTDITELKRAEESLRQSEGRLRQAESIAGMGSLDWDLETDRILLSDEACRLYGISQEHNLTTPEAMTRVIHPDDVAFVSTALEFAIRGDRPCDIDHRLLLADGTVRWIHVQAELLQDSKGEGKRLLGTVLDITGRQQAMDALHEREERYQKLIDLLPDALLVNVKGLIVLANPACCKLLGATEPSELIGKSIFEIIHPDFQESVKERRRVTLAGGTSPLTEEKYVRLDGSVVEVETAASGIEWRGLRGTQVIIRDTTERKQGERELRESRERYRRLFEDHGAAKLVIDIDTGSILDANQAASRFYGWSREQLKNMTLQDINLIQPEQLRTLIERTASKGEDHFEFRHRHADGSTRDVEMFTSVIEIDGKKVFESIIHDVSDRRMAEAEIRRLNRIYTVLSNVNQAIVRIHDVQQLFSETCRIAVQDGGFVMAWLGVLMPESNRVAVLSSFGEVGSYLADINIDLNDVNVRKGPTARAVLSGRHVVSNDIEHDDNMAPWTENASKMGYRSSAAFPVKVSDNVWGAFNLYSREAGSFNADEVKLLEELAMDISFAIEVIQKETERKEAEQSLRRSEELLRSSVRVANIGVYERDHLNDLVYSSPRQRQIHGLPPNEPIEFDTFLRQIHPEDVERIASRVRESHDPSGDGLWSAQYRIVRPDGSVRWLLGFAETVFEGGNGERHPVRTIGAVLDITDQKRAEEQLRLSGQIIDRVNSLILIVDARGLITYVSPSAKPILGYEREELLEDGWWRLARRGGVPGHNQESAAAVASGELPMNDSAYETMVYAKDGTIRWILWQESKGPDRELIGVGQNITERKLAEEALVLSEQKYRDIFESAPLGIFRTTPDGKFTTCNKEMARILGYETPEEMVGLSMANDIYVDGTLRGPIAREVETQGHIFDKELLWKKRDSTPIWVQVDARSIKGSDGRTLRFEGFVRDVTDRMVAEELLRENEARRRELERGLIQSQKLESLGTLASGVAHDFNNLLGVIMGHASLLQGHLRGSSTIVQKGLDAILTASNRGAGLVKQMLTFARKTDVATQPVLLNDIVDEVRAFVQETFPKTISVEIKLEKDLPLIDADPTQVHQVLLNLCVNARDAMLDGGVLTIATNKQDRSSLLDTFSAVTAEDYAGLSVTDTGTGMDEETQRRIFEPFFTTKEQGMGTGLGLSLVFGIMQSHNGFVGLRSEPNHGTTFNCFFPVPTGMGDAVSSALELPESIPSGSETVLVVEDEEPLRELLRQVLTSKGYSVLLAENGEEGFAIYRERRGEIALVLSDLGLPKFGGDELYRRLKEVDADVILLLASGFVEPQLKRTLLEDGVKAVISKPYSLNEVLQAVRRILDESRPPSDAR